MRVPVTTCAGSVPGVGAQLPALNKLPGPPVTFPSYRGVRVEEGGLTPVTAGPSDLFEVA